MKRLDQAMLWGAERGTGPLSAVAARFPKLIGARIMGDVIHRWYRVDCVDKKDWPEFPGDPDPEIGALPATFKRQSVLEVPRDSIHAVSLGEEDFWPAAAYRLGKSTLAAPMPAEYRMDDSSDVVYVGLGQGAEPLVATLGALGIESRLFLPFRNVVNAGELVSNEDLAQRFPGAIRL